MLPTSGRSTLDSEQHQADLARIVGLKEGIESHGCIRFFDGFPKPVEVLDVLRSCFEAAGRRYADTQATIPNV